MSRGPKIYLEIGRLTPNCASVIRAVRHSSGLSLTLWDCFELRDMLREQIAQFSNLFVPPTCLVPQILVYKWAC